MPELVIVVRILLSAILGGLVGIEREIHGCAAGLRTHILVSIGSAVFMIVSIMVTLKYGHLGDVDPSRIASNVVTGIGFLGAGAIIRYGASIRGLTTAASIWAVAAIGLSVGSGLYVASVVTTAVVIGTLFLSRLEKRMEGRWHGRRLLIRLRFVNEDTAEQIKGIIESYEGKAKQIKRRDSDSGKEGAIELDLDVTLSELFLDIAEAKILSLPEVKEIKWE